jgi:hypothetical protein
MRLDDAIRAGLVALVRLGEKTHILAKAWYPLEDGERVAEHMFFCGGRPPAFGTRVVNRETFNDTACKTCTRKYTMAKIKPGLSRAWVPKATYQTKCLVGDE